MSDMFFIKEDWTFFSECDSITVSILLQEYFYMAKTTIPLPGAVLKGLLDSYHISVAKISEEIGLSPSAIRQLVSSKLKISAIIALKLGKYFDKKPEYWINLQANYELSLLQKDPKVTAVLKTVPRAQKQPAPKPVKSAAKPAAVKGAKGKAAAKSAAAKPARKPRTVKAKPAPVPAPSVQ
ncbi:MAG: HigA family addiction module antidote protein [Treponema sp.]|jgi:addiction module HigA family antidote|nr:HigA family addiction module antidote protein [Treponema sp.]